MVILFKIVQRSKNKNSRVDASPQSTGASVVSYAPGHIGFDYILSMGGA